MLNKKYLKDFSNIDVLFDNILQKRYYIYIKKSKCRKNIV